MQKGKNVIGKAVLSLASGARVDTVSDVLIGAGNDQVVALLIDEGGLLSTSKVVPFEEVHGMGPDAVVINSEEAVVAASSDPDVKGILTRPDHLRGKTVFTEDGRRMGSIADVYFDDTTGRILGFEVSNGALGDLAKGTSYMATEELRLAGHDIVFVSSAGADQIEGQVGGIQAALAKAGDQIGQATEGAKSQIAGQVDAVRSQGDQEETPEQRLVGKRSGADVTDERGSIVVASGQRITADQVQTAKETGNLDALFVAAEAGEARERDERASELARQAGDTAADLWDRFTSKLSEVTDATGQRADEQQTRTRLAQITDAIGRPVTKVILDRDDEVILDLGDLITHQSVQQAHDAGMLDTLLTCVYRGEVAFERDEMRAKVEGAATVEKASGGAEVIDEMATRLQEADEQREAEKQTKKQQDEAARQARSKEREERASTRAEAAEERETADQERREAVAVAVEGDSPTD